MADSLEIKKTTKLVYFIAQIKETEISFYERKVIQLKEIMDQDPNNSINEYKYNLAKMRYDQLKRTTKGLRRLEQKIVNLKKNQAS